MQRQSLDEQTEWKFRMLNRLIFQELMKPDDSDHERVKTYFMKIGIESMAYFQYELGPKSDDYEGE